MIKKLWCLIWGHIVISNDYSHPDGPDYFYIRKAEYCKRCGKDLRFKDNHKDIK